MRDCHVAINLVGILAEAGAQKFDAVQGAGAAAVAKAAATVGARLVHVSAIGADPLSPSRYGRSKAAGEEAALAAVPSATILRPSVVFGPEDEFTNRFAALARVSPFLPLIGGGLTRPSRSMSAMSPPRSPTPSMARPGPARRMSLAVRKC